MPQTLQSKSRSGTLATDTKTLGRAWERAYEQIRNKILSIELAPGEVISELSLAHELGVSRTPVREAIKRLEQEGLIQSGNKRKRVYILRVREVDEIFDIKKGIEGQIAEVAVQRKREQQDQELRKIADEMAEFAWCHSFENLTQDHSVIFEWLILDERFHTLLFEMARNDRARRIIQNLNQQWHRLELGILAMEGRLERNITEHQELATAVLRGDGKEARRLMIIHLERLHSTIANIMKMFHFPG